MASLDFPISPNDLDTYEANNVIYTFNATKGLWQATSNVTVTGGGAVDLSAVDQNIIPSANLTYTIGSYESQWSTVYANLYIGDGGLLSNIVGGVASVNGEIGDVVLTTANVNESGNLYFTNSRVIANVVTYLDTAPYVNVTNNLIVTANIVAGGYKDVNGNLLIIQDEGGNVIWGL